MNLKKIKKYFRPFLAVLLLYLLFRSGFLKFDQLKMSLQNPIIISAGIIAFALQIAVFALRWKKISDIFHGISFKQALRLNLIGQFFNFFIPSGVGGDVVKALEMSKFAGLPKKKTFTLIALDRVLGLYAMICFSLVFLLIENLNHPTPELKKFLIISGLMFIIASTGLMASKAIHRFLLKRPTPENLAEQKLTLLQKIEASLKTLTEGFQSALNVRTLTWIFSTSLIAQILSISFIYIVSTELTQSEPSFLIFFPLACFAFMASSIPVTPGGIGFGQAAFYFIFSAINEDVANSVVIAISLMQFFQLIYGLPGAYLFMTSRKKYESQLISES